MTPCETNELEGIKEHRVGTYVEDPPLKFQLKTRRSTDRFALFVWQGSAQLFIVTTSNSTTGLRNETSSDTLSRFLLVTT